MQSGSRQLIRAVVLSAALACAGLCAAAEPTLKLTANVIWHRDDPWFGGFSGAEVSANGGQITLLSDKGTMVQAEMLRRDGSLHGLRVNEVFRPRHPSGQPIGGEFADGEGIALAPDGKIYLSFEHAQRVVRLDPNTQITTRLPGHPDFDRMARNKQLEALAIHPDGTLYTLAERVPTHRRAFPLYAFLGGTWRVTHQIPRRGPFMMVGADFDASGHLYLLERALTPVGFRSRVRRFNLEEQDLEEVTLITSSAGRFDNLEALSVWQDPEGNTRLTLISDDNFRSIQRTQIVEYIVTEPLAPGPTTP